MSSLEKSGALFPSGYLRLEPLNIARELKFLNEAYFLLDSTVKRFPLEVEAFPSHLLIAFP